MKLKLILSFMILSVVSFSFTPALMAQAQVDSLSMLVTTLLKLPTLKGVPLTQAFMTGSTYIAAFVAFASIYLAQWIPFVKTALAKIPSGYLRAIIVGGGALWAIVANTGVYDTQAVVAFVLSNVIWEILKNVLPTSPMKQEMEYKKTPDAEVEGQQ
jgi:hypothetical protein